MGAYLRKPVTTKESLNGGATSEYTEYGVSSMQGWRHTMEDAHVAEPSTRIDGMGFYGVFDGHGGATVSTWISKHILDFFEREVEKLSSNPNTKLRVDDCESVPRIFALYAEALESTFLELDNQLKDEQNFNELLSIFEQKKKDNSISETDTIDPSSTCPQIIYNDDGTPAFYMYMTSSGPQITFCDAVDDYAVDNSDVNNQWGELDWNESMDMKFWNENKADISIESGYNETETTALSSDDSNDTSTSKASDKRDTVMEGSHENEETENNTHDIVDEDKEFEEEVPGVFNTEEDDELLNADESPSEEEAQLNTLNEPKEMSLKDISDICGATAIVVVIAAKPEPALIIANAGDSRAVLCRNGVAIPLSHDHKPMLSTELKRIENAGGTVSSGRVDGNLNLSRCIGDLYYKRDEALDAKEQRITAFPDVRIVRLTPEDDFIIIACDGIWEVRSSQEVVDFVSCRLPSRESQQKVNYAKICEELCDVCLSASPVTTGGLGCDNMTCSIVRLKKPLINTNPTVNEIVLYDQEQDIHLYGESD